MKTRKFLLYSLLFVSGFIGFIFINSIPSISGYYYFGLALLMIASAVLAFIEYDKYVDTKNDISLFRMIISENQALIGSICILITIILAIFSAKNNKLIQILPVITFILGMIMLIWKPFIVHKNKIAKK